jgi:hypothetical protein
MAGIEAEAELHCSAKESKERWSVIRPGQAPALYCQISQYMTSIG